MAYDYQVLDAHQDCLVIEVLPSNMCLVTVGEETTEGVQEGNVTLDAEQMRETGHAFIKAANDMDEIDSIARDIDKAVEATKRRIVSKG